MNAPKHPMASLADVRAVAEQAGRRDMVSAIDRICQMLGCDPAGLPAKVAVLRARLASIRPARHGIKAKTWANRRSLFIAALELAGVIEPLGRGMALRDPRWGPRLATVKDNKRIAQGLAAFANWCVREHIAPDEVEDADVLRFHEWLEARTLHPRPRDVARRVPNLWNDAGEGWPPIRLTPISFKTPSRHIPLHELDAGFHAEVEAYLEMRLEPDMFEEDPAAPARALAPSTVGQQRKYICYAANALIRQGRAVAEISSLDVLVEIDAFKTILRHEHNRAGGKPNAQAVLVAKTLIDVARYHVKVPEDHLKEMKRLAARLPQCEGELNEKTKELLRQLECERTRARLLFLPETLQRKCEAALRAGKVPQVDSQVSIAVAMQLTAPLRPQNLVKLNWSKNFIEPQGPAGPLLLVIPKKDTKTKRQDLTFEIPKEVADMIRWYRRTILPLLGADPNGNLFVNQWGKPKNQETLCQQIEEHLADYVGVKMSVHQFRHVVGVWYLDEHPERFQDVVDLLGHAWAKTTKIYVGNSSRRASRAYNSFIAEKRNALKLQRQRSRKRRK